MDKKLVPIGYENFKSLIESNLYYVDKTLIIDELIVMWYIVLEKNYIREKNIFYCEKEGL